MKRDKIIEAYNLAKEKHSGQKDLSGIDYIKHPVKVASYCKTVEEKVVALLHDTLEDTNLTKNEIRQKFGDKIAEAVDIMTKKEGESYMDYIRRCGTNNLTKTVKLADLRHNMQMDRLTTITEKDITRFNKYKKAKQMLESIEF